MPLFAPPMQVPPLQSGQGWMPVMVAAGSVDVSPVRKMMDASGASRLDSPVVQFTVPETADAIAFRTQVLVGIEEAFGTASGEPKKQPASVQFRRLPVSAWVAEPTVAVFVAWSHAVILLTASPWS